MRRVGIFILVLISITFLGFACITVVPAMLLDVLGWSNRVSNIIGKLIDKL